ncbi:hypothetical protein K502DRAFT_350920 [Neoconidiobolus thromboides FSU 785]|nr:hypothetical protein K502DRAFT_350920 [Neoconidiobolus thromboides FSU 785]
MEISELTRQKQVIETKVGQELLSSKIKGDTALLNSLISTTAEVTYFVSEIIRVLTEYFLAKSRQLYFSTDQKMNSIFNILDRLRPDSTRFSTSEEFSKEDKFVYSGIGSSHTQLFLDRCTFNPFTNLIE